MYEFISFLLNPILWFFVVIVAVIVLIWKNKEYKKGAYYQVTKQPYFSLKFDIGKYGEYLTYKCLKKFETVGAKFLFNVYVPKQNGETSEIDVLMISSKGIFVFESKNYSGWIFGTETQKNWYQTLPEGRGRSHKESFYNPVMQNSSHIKHLKTFLNEDVPMWSIIVFSDRCTLKSIDLYSDDISVINRCNVAPIVNSFYKNIKIDLLTENDIARIYNKLYPYTQVDKTVKMQHIANVHNNTAPKPVQFIAKKSVEITPRNELKTETEQNGSIIVSDVIDETNGILVEELSENVIPDIHEQSILKCPRCNGDLILRTANRGTNSGKQFYGCSNYPKCKYIKNI